MLIYVSLIQIIIVCLNNYRSQPFIGPYKDNFLITIDVGLKTTKSNKVLYKESYASMIPIRWLNGEALLECVMINTMV